MAALNRCWQWRWPQPDPWLVLPILGLAALGLVMVASTSLHLAEAEGLGAHYYLRRHGLFLGVGLLGATLLALLPLRWWQRLGLPALLLGLGLLVLVLLVGNEVNGARRWLALPGWTMQPSEVARVLFLIYLAGYLERQGGVLAAVNRDPGWGPTLAFVKPMLLAALMGGLLLLEPDFGAAALLIMTVFGVLFLAGARWRDVLVLLVLGAGLLSLAVISSGYRMRRLLAFLDPWGQQADAGYQIVQSMMAFGRGEWAGVGLGAGLQKLGFLLDQAHNDYIFASLGEELGLLGVVAVVLLYALVIWRGFQIAGRARDAGQVFGAYLAYGLVLGLALQALLNMGVNLGMLPPKGVTLPLISYGGTSLLVTLGMIGLLCRVEMELRDGASAAALVAVPAPRRRRKTGRREATA